MKNITLVFSSIILLLGIFTISWKKPSIDEKHQEKSTYTVDENFKNHWGDGKAEIASYDLQQSRYGELHTGEATMIFVTEPFSKSKQVKLDNHRNKKDKVEVLKLNAVRKFNTGIYPYSTMTSIFNAYETDGKALKVSTSVQEWCGHAFLQFNRKGNKVNFSGHSYFESEGDVEADISDAYMEDELWNMIRINPELLPTGNFKLIPASLFLRLKHHSPQVTSASAKLTKTQNQQFSDGELYEYTVEYTQPETRAISIYFDTTFPFQIKGWQEKGRPIQLGTSSEAAPLTTTAILKKAIRLDYWSKHNNVHRELKSLLE